MEQKGIPLKDIYFLGGLPRSGNTLLSALLNQHPDIYSSPLSPLLQAIDSMENIKNSEEAQIVDFDSSITSAIKGYVNGFYSDCSKPVVIDRCKGWGTKQSMFLSYKYITDKPKVIFTVRDIPSILSSFINILGTEPTSYVDDALRVLKVYAYGNQSQNDLRCEWLMNNQIQASMVALTELLQIGVPVLLIEYDDLVDNPQGELNKIYKFLNLPQYKNNLTDIKKVETENLNIAHLPDELHTVRKQISKTSLTPKDNLPKSILDKYSGLEFWRN